MYWADEMAQAIIKSGKHTPYWVDDMKTPSGRVHIGSVRAVLTHYFVYRALVDAGVEAKFSYVFEDHDPFDKVPSYLNKEDFEEYLGLPLYKVPSPEEGYKSYGHRWGKEYEEIFNGIGVFPQIIWGSELYQSGKMDPYVRICLDKTEEVKSIYRDMYQQEKGDNWYPINLACEKCGKIATTVVSDWDGEEVTYACSNDSYTKCCGYSGKQSPFGGNAKLPWKVEWPCKWQAIGVTVEGAGKDHMSEGGSHDFAKLMCERVLECEVPYHFSHEFFLTGGRKMSSSKGVGSSAKEVSQIIPPYLIRFIVARVKYNRAINIDPNGPTIPDLFDDYDRCAKAYWTKSDEKPARVYELSQVSEEMPEEHFLPRFRDITRILQDPKLDIQKEMTANKGSELTDVEQEVLAERIHYAKIWLKDYAPREDVIELSQEIPEAAHNLSDEQKAYLSKVLVILEAESWQSPDELQQTLYTTSKEMGLGAKQAFGSIYMSLIDKTHGPRAAWLIIDNLEKTIQRFKDILSGPIKKEKVYTLPTLSSDIAYVNAEAAESYPSLVTGFAIIKGVKVEESSPALRELMDETFEKAKPASNDEINNSTKVVSYRNAIKQSGISWHSRRPTMDALLRRLVKGQRPPFINNIADIGNMMAVKHHMSQGLFDLDTIAFPIYFGESKEGQEVVVFGSDEPLKLKDGEICYFDQKGPFQIDLCWRDAQRTSVKENTTNLLVQTDGILDVSREDVETMLKDFTETIIKYAGGTVETMGIIQAKE